MLQRNSVIAIGALLALVIIGVLVIQRQRAAYGAGSAFHVGEAGLHYILHTLNSGVCTPEELSKQDVVQALPGADGKESPGVFSVELTQNAEGWQVTSLGQVAGFMGPCVKITAAVEKFSGSLGDKYRIVSWDERGTAGCMVRGGPTSLTCEGVK